jgi:hypothetical protein
MLRLVRNVYPWLKLFRLIIRSDDLPQILITVLSLNLGIYILLSFGNLYHVLSQKQANWIARCIYVVNWVGCFLISLLTLVFLILGCKDIRGGLTFYTWVSQTFYNFDFRLIFILRAGNFHFVEYICYPQPDSKVVESDVQQLSDPGWTNFS